VHEFLDVFFSQLLVYGGDGDWRGLVGEEVAVVGCLQVQLDVLECLALDEVYVVGVLKDAALEAADKALQVAVVDVEHYV